MNWLKKLFVGDDGMRAQQNAMLDFAQAAYESGTRPRVLQAACRTGEGIIHTLPRPWRHHNIIHALALMGHKQCECCEQGFLISTGEFASREEAEKIAFAANQVKGGKIIGGCLTSEDMW